MVPKREVQVRLTCAGPRPARGARAIAETLTISLESFHFAKCGSSLPPDHQTSTAVVSAKEESRFLPFAKSASDSSLRHRRTLPISRTGLNQIYPRGRTARSANRVGLGGTANHASRSEQTLPELRRSRNHSVIRRRNRKSSEDERPDHADSADWSSRCHADRTSA